MIVDAILRAIYGGGKREIAPAPVALSDNLERFFGGKERLAGTASCCPPAAQAACCEPSEKASCCGDGVSSSCGCQ